MVIVAKEGFKGLNSIIVIWVMVLFYFGIFHLMPFNSAYMSKCELVTNLWRHYWSYNNPPDVMKTRLMVQAKRELNDQENALIGAFAGAITGAITTPLDVMKTRVMVQGHGSQYSGIVSCAQTILREEGSRAFLKGIEPRVLWIGIGGSIFFGVLEKTKSMLAGRRNREVGTLKDE